MSINDFGFLRVAAASPLLKVADCDYNIQEIKSVISKAAEQQVQMLCFPELSITGATCGDLFLQSVLQKKALRALDLLSKFLKQLPGIIVIVGLPLKVKNNLFNVAAVLSDQGVLGIVPKMFISQTDDLSQSRWFTSGAAIESENLIINGQSVDVYGDGVIFKTPFANFAVEIGTDLHTIHPPSLFLASDGAEIIFNPSAVNDLVGRNQYMQSLIQQQSVRTFSAYIAAFAGWGESTTDLIFSGGCYIAENGVMLEQSERFSTQNEWIISDIDIEALRFDRMNNRISDVKAPHEIECNLNAVESNELFYRSIPSNPFLHFFESENESFSDLYHLQAFGLMKRLQHTGIQSAVIGISGGLDSTLALLVTVKAYDLLGVDRKNIHGITMPGFGTTDRTYDNAVALMRALGITTQEISIKEAVTLHLRDIDHDLNKHDITYENAQARERTQILMDYANKIGGLVVGTGNMSELALGWSTYNGDHMSMYAVNAGVPKTVVSTLTHWIALTQPDETIREILIDITETPFSPELLPADKMGNIAQKTEHFVGPYELHDFFLYRMFRYGDAPKRILFLAEKAFQDKYNSDEIKQWLRVFYGRFFSQQFKRSCMPDGPKVGAVNLSPRGSWSMPSDAVVKIWMDELD